MAAGDDARNRSLEAVGPREHGQDDAGPGLDFRTLAEALPQIVWSCGADGKHDYFNARWQEFTGYPADVTSDADPKIWETLVHPEDRDRVFATWQECLITGAPYDIDYRFRRVSGDFRWLRVMARPHLDDRGRVVRWFGTSTDIHDTTLATFERERTTQALRIRADVDHLTGLLNRRALFERATARLTSGATLASVLMIDIDNFKSINDTYGHLAGDAVLRDLALRFNRTVPSESLLCRFGGEEFIVLICPSSIDIAHRIAGRLRTSATVRPVTTAAVGIVEQQEINVTVSIGGCTRSAGTMLTTLIEDADRALYRAKANGRDRYEATP